MTQEEFAQFRERTLGQLEASRRDEAPPTQGDTGGSQPQPSLIGVNTQVEQPQEPPTAAPMQPVPTTAPTTTVWHHLPDGDPPAVPDPTPGPASSIQLQGADLDQCARCGELRGHHPFVWDHEFVESAEADLASLTETPPIPEESRPSGSRPNPVVTLRGEAITQDQWSNLLNSNLPPNVRALLEQVNLDAFNTSAAADDDDNEPNPFSELH